MQPRQKIRHVLLHACVDAQVFARIEYQLETRHIVAVAREQRRPRDLARLRQLGADLAEYLCERRAVETAEQLAAGRMQNGQDRFVAVRHHRGHEHIAPVGFDERPAFIG